MFEIPVFKAFPNMDTMVAIVIFAMMAIGLNMVVGYAGLLDLGYVAFYAIGAYTAPGSRLRTLRVRTRWDPSIDF